MTRSVTLALFAAAAITATVAYQPALSAGLFYEDARWVLAESPSVLAVPGRWLTAQTMIWQLGATPRALHLTSFALHLACALAVFRVARRWGLETPAALVAAVALLWTPAATQAVAYTSARGELLLALLALLAAGSTSPWAWLACGAGLMLTKETGALPGAALVALVGWTWVGDPRARLWATVSLAAAVAGTTFVRWHALLNFGWADPAEHLGLLARSLGVFATAGLVYPNVDPDPANLGRWLAAGALLLALTAAVAIFYPAARLLLALAALSWLPRLIISTGDAPQEHHAYLAVATAALTVGVAWQTVTSSVHWNPWRDITCAYDIS